VYVALAFASYATRVEGKCTDSTCTISITTE